MPHSKQHSVSLFSAFFALALMLLSAHAVTAQADIDTLMRNVEDAKRAWLEAALQDGLGIPEPQSLRDYSGQFKLRLPKSLHQQLAEHAKQEGVSMNQYCVYLLTQQDARFSTKHVS